MYRNHKLGHRMLAYILLLSSCLQSCYNSTIPSDDMKRRGLLSSQQPYIEEKGNEEFQWALKKQRGDQVRIEQLQEKEAYKVSIKTPLWLTKDYNIKEVYQDEKEKKRGWQGKVIARKHLLAIPLVCAACSTSLKKRTSIGSACLKTATKSSFLWSGCQSMVRTKSCFLTSTIKPPFQFNINVYRTTRRLNSTLQLAEGYVGERTPQSSFPFPRAGYIELGVGAIAGAVVLAGQAEREEEKEDEKEDEKDYWDKKETDQGFIKEKSAGDPEA